MVLCRTRDMSFPQHVGLVALGGAGWMGGSNYVRSVAAAIRAASPATKISFICPKSLLPDWRECASVIPVKTQRTLRARLFDRTPRLPEAVTHAGIEFVYPGPLG